MENVATALVGEERSTGNTAAKLFSESGNLEKYTLIGKSLVDVAVAPGGTAVVVVPGPEVMVCCGVDVAGVVDVEDIGVVVDVGVFTGLVPQAARVRTNKSKQMPVMDPGIEVWRNERVGAVEAF